MRVACGSFLERKKERTGTHAGRIQKRRTHPEVFGILVFIVGR
jgi:hypothetical protein